MYALSNTKFNIVGNYTGYMVYTGRCRPSWGEAILTAGEGDAYLSLLHKPFTGAMQPKGEEQRRGMADTSIDDSLGNTAGGTAQESRYCPLHGTDYFLM